MIGVECTQTVLFVFYFIIFYFIQISKMAQGYEFGAKNPGMNNDKLEHYRIQIRKLKQLNKTQEERYQKKIANLEKQLSSGSRPKKIPFPDQSKNMNSQLIKKDKQINRLVEENDKLRKQNYHNPDRQLLKNRDMSQSIADKDQQIARLKNAIHELQSKYDGRYFNQNKIKKDYQLLIKQNQELRKEAEDYGGKKQTTKNEVSPQIFEIIKYKKNSQLFQRQNQHLKKQLKQISGERTSKGNQYILGANTQNQVLRKQMKSITQKNKELFHKVEKLQVQNKKLLDQNERLRKQKNSIQSQPFKRQQQTYLSQKKYIFDRKPIQESQMSDYRPIQSVMKEEPKKSAPETIRKAGYYSEFKLNEVGKRSDD